MAWEFNHQSSPAEFSRPYRPGNSPSLATRCHSFSFRSLQRRRGHLQWLCSPYFYMRHSRPPRTISVIPAKTVPYCFPKTSSVLFYLWAFPASSRCIAVSFRQCSPCLFSAVMRPRPLPAGSPYLASPVNLSRHTCTPPPGFTANNKRSCMTSFTPFVKPAFDSSLSHLCDYRQCRLRLSTTVHGRCSGTHWDRVRIQRRINCI